MNSDEGRAPQGRVQSHRERFVWIEEIIADDELTDGEKIVGIRIAQHVNMKSLRADPSIEGLALRTARTVRAVEKTITKLEVTGWIARGGRRNLYYLLKQKTPNTQTGSTPNRRSELTPNNSNANPEQAFARTPNDTLSKPRTSGRANI